MMLNSKAGSSPSRRAYGLVMLALSMLWPTHAMPDMGRDWLGLPPLTIATENSQSTSAPARLGEAIFFDKRLSANGQVSCATCHRPELAFTDGLRTAVGVLGTTTTRNTPSLINVAFVTDLFWDGRSSSLEHQALQPLVAPAEHGLVSLEAALKVLRSVDEYSELSKAAFDKASWELAPEDLGAALAAFQRTLVLGGSPFDHFFFGGDKGAIDDQAKRGFELFVGAAGCGACHSVSKGSALFTDNQFHSIGFRGDAAAVASAIVKLKGLPSDKVGHLLLVDEEVATLGRFVATRQLEDIGKFRTPSLRNVALTAPYMHDGRLNTLEEAVEYELYHRGLRGNAPIILTPQERADLVAFLKTLTSAALARGANRP